MTETISQPGAPAALDATEQEGAGPAMSNQPEPESVKPGTGLLVLAPLRLEANAVRRGLTDPASIVVTAGLGASRGRKAAAKAGPTSFGALAVMGTAAGLSDDLAPGDLVVASAVTDGETTVTLPGAGLLAAELGRAGLRARAGRVVTVPKLVRGSDRERLAAGGYLVADMESGALRGGRGRPPAGGRSGRCPTPGSARGWSGGGIAALKSLRQAAPVDREVGRRLPRADCAAGRAAVVLRRGRAGDRDRRARPGAARRAGLRAQADRAQHPGRLRPGGPRRGLRGRAGRGAGRRHGGVLRPRGVARGARRRERPRPVGHRRDLPAGVEGARRGPPVRPRGLHPGADRPRRATRRSRAPWARRPTRPCWCRRRPTWPRSTSPTAPRSPT